MIVTVQGLKGEGKSTLAREISNHLKSLGVNVHLVDVGHEVALEEVLPVERLKPQHSRLRPVACLVEVIE